MARLGFTCFLIYLETYSTLVIKGGVNIYIYIFIYVYIYTHILYRYITYLALKTVIVENW